MDYWIFKTPIWSLCMHMNSGDLDLWFHVADIYRFYHECRPFSTWRGISLTSNLYELNMRRLFLRHSYFPKGEIFLLLLMNTLHVHFQLFPKREMFCITNGYVKLLSVASFTKQQLKWHICIYGMKLGSLLYMLQEYTHSQYLSNDPRCIRSAITHNDDDATNVLAMNIAQLAEFVFVLL